MRAKTGSRYTGTLPYRRKREEKKGKVTTLHKLHCTFHCINSTKEKKFCKTSYQVGMDPKKYKNKVRDERMQEDYTLHLPKIHSRCRAVFLRSFISCLVSALFSGPSSLEMKFCRNLFFSFCSFLGCF